MSDTFHCGDHDGLIAYLYEECEPSTRTAIAAHLAACARCAEELRALSGTRQLLAAWTPPETALGWRLSEDHRGVQRFGGGRPTAEAWWRQPLPAWAQLAAALLIFASGLAVGLRTGSTPASSDEAVGVVDVVDVGADWRPAVTEMERRIEAVEAANRANEALVAALRNETPDTEAVLREVGRQIGEAEERLRGDFHVGLVVLKAEENQMQQILTDDIQELSSQVRYVTQQVQQTRE